MKSDYAPNCEISIGDNFLSRSVGVFNGKQYSICKIGNILITSDVGYEANKQKDYSFVQACKDPYHRQAVKYTGRGCPKDSPEYLYAVRGNRFIMNIVDADDPSFFKDEMIDSAIKFINNSTCPVMVHCNEGKSRGPSIALLYLVKNGTITGTTEEIFGKFRQFCPEYSPKEGIYLYARHRINKMVNGDG
jgi:hypothetical protein